MRNKLKTIRESMGLSQAEFGKKFGLEWYQIKDMEGGKTRTKVEIEVWLAKEGYNLNWFIADIGAMTAEENEEILLKKLIITQEKLIEAREEIILLQKKLLETNGIHMEGAEAM